MKFHLQNPEDFAAASKSLISKSASNVGGVELNIIGATTMEQLKTCIDSVHIDLTKEIINEIKKIHTEIPHPAP